MVELAGERCQACSSGTPPLQAADLAELLAQLDPAWELSPGLLRRHFGLPDFAASFTLATRLALLAEREGHHPDLHLGWGHLDVDLTTHAAGGLTRNDFVMAAKIDRLAARCGQAGEP
ncbi:MAG: 4a-hydroxytetrahydrobiopterin dehydratase [Candidatus Dormibacteria bacterium]